MTKEQKQNIANMVLRGEDDTLEITSTVVKAPDTVKMQINALKKALAATDYKLLKYIEGEITDAEYEPVKEMRKAIRQQINDLEESK